MASRVNIAVIVVTSADRVREVNFGTHFLTRSIAGRKYHAYVLRRPDIQEVPGGISRMRENDREIGSKSPVVSALDGMRLPSIRSRGSAAFLTMRDFWATPVGYAVNSIEKREARR